MYTEIERERVVDYLQERMAGANEIIIVDPYFLNESKNIEIENYLNDIGKVLGRTRKILLITHWSSINYEIEVKQFFKRKRIKFFIFKTNKLHDRLWIKDKTNHFVIGSSFNGIGFSFGFIYQLEREMIKEKIKEHLLNKIRSSRIPIDLKNEMVDFF